MLNQHIIGNFELNKREIFLYMGLNMKNQLKPFLNRVGEQFSQNWYHIRDIHGWMLEEIYRKRKTFPYWKKKVLFSHVSWKKNHPVPNDPSHELINSASFFYNKFDWLFRYFIEKLFSPFEASQLKLIERTGDPHKMNSDLFLEYHYYLEHDEIIIFQEFKEVFNIPDEYPRIITYTMNLVIMTFSELVKKILKQKYNISMICADFKHDSDRGSYIHFIISCRDLDKIFYKKYLFSLIYHFAEVLPQIDQELLSKLRTQQRKIYKYAFQEYSKGPLNLHTTLLALKKKVKIVGHLTPLLDILNFIASRVEDSIYDTKNLIRQVLHKENLFPANSKVMEDFILIFSFVNEAASLFSTLQSSNRANPQKQYQLFFFYSQHFFGARIEDMDTIPSTFFKDILKKSLENAKFDIIEPTEIQVFFNFIFHGLELTPNADKALRIIFLRIFGESINHLNEEFFESYLFSLNQKFHTILQEFNQNHPNNQLSFEETVNILDIILFNLADTIFLEETPDLAQKHFKDQLSRYTPERIALRVLELKIFKEIPLSDNNWQDYFLSRNRVKVKRIFKNYFEIPENYFFSPERLLKINMIYERGLLKKTPFLEEWLIKRLLTPFYQFQQRVNQNLSESPSTNEIVNVLYQDFSKGVIEPRILARIEELAEFFTYIWKI
jgi:hypothetical protein